MGLYSSLDGPGCVPQPTITAASAIPGPSNLRVAATCEGEAPTRCLAPPACADATACKLQIFEAWTAASNGSAEITSQGLRLRPGAPCFVAESPKNLIGAVAVDAFKTARSAPASFGAHEQDICVR